MHLFLSAYNENTVISKEYTDPLDFDITGADCKYQKSAFKLSYFLNQLIAYKHLYM